MRSIPPSSSATRATTATAFATTWRSEASNPSSRRDRTATRQSNTIGKPTSGATSSSDASIASSNSGASPPDTRKPRELTFRCYASQQRNSGSKPSTRPSIERGVEHLRHTVLVCPYRTLEAASQFPSGYGLGLAGLHGMRTRSRRGSFHARASRDAQHDKLLLRVGGAPEVHTSVPFFVFFHPAAN